MTNRQNPSENVSQEFKCAYCKKPIKYEEIQESDDLMSDLAEEKSESYELLLDALGSSNESGSPYIHWESTLGYTAKNVCLACLTLTQKKLHWILDEEKDHME